MKEEDFREHFSPALAELKSELLNVYKVREKKTKGEEEREATGKRSRKTKKKRRKREREGTAEWRTAAHERARCTYT